MTPSFSVLLAAAALVHRVGSVHFEGDSGSYARVIGLNDALEGRRPAPSSGQLSGETYSPLCRIDDQDDVDRANRTVSSTLEHHLSTNPELLHYVRYVIGELHDNVASHARGVGFSAAQVYGDFVQFSVADAGRGFLSTARQAVPELATDFDAIEWCMGKDNTSAAKVEAHAQKSDPDDPFESFPDYVPLQTSRNHHQGLGLFELRKCVEAAQGHLVLVSGNGAIYLRPDGTTTRIPPPIPWSGVFIEFELPSSAVLPSDEENPRLQELGKFLGWTS